MSATNSTTHYELPVFIATDKPAWLVDWNGSMSAIDSAIYAAKSAADTAQAGVTANASDISTLSSTVSTQGSSLSTLSENLTTLTGTVNTITSLIGNGEPTTTDKTIIGAINEINAEVSTPTAASAITYDNTTSGMTADDVQEAIDENAASIATLNSALTQYYALDFSGVEQILISTSDTTVTKRGVFTNYNFYSSSTTAGYADIYVNSYIFARFQLLTNIRPDLYIPVEKGDKIKYSLSQGVTVSQSTLYFIPYKIQ